MMSGLSSYVGRDFVRLRLRLGRKLGGMGLKLASLRAPGQWNGSLGFAMVLKSCIVSGVFQAAVEMSGCPREQRSGEGIEVALQATRVGQRGRDDDDAIV